MKLGSEVAVVTGASSGIGAELARRLAAEGVKVGLTARRADLLEEVAATIRAAGGTAAVAPADAADARATREAITRLAAELGPVDLLVANAGLGLSTPAATFSAELVEQIVRVNLLGPAYAIEAVLPDMLVRGRGHLVGISSLAAYRGLPDTAGYCASKAGLTALLESLRVELHPRGIAVTVVHPGFVRTPMIAGSTDPQPFVMDVEPAVRIILRGIAARRPAVAFPWPTAALASLGRWLPPRISDPVTRWLMMPRKKTDS
jgi:short-subunit dehydrogenase